MHILFDLDGTLTDSRPGIINSIRHSLAENQLTVPEADALLWCIGPPILESFRKLVGPDQPHLFDPTVTKYRERYSETGIFENEVYPEIVDTLAELRQLGHTLHVATSKAEIYAKRIITHFELDRFFTSVNGSELDGTRADKAELIAHILLQQGISPAEAVMIGDREHDMIGATKNNLPAIGALWGYGTGKELMESGATLCARVPHLLPEMISSLE
ncbi:HAD hydrolase-like protein [Luteolibacter yonseiensis]|uniref:HAD hydrolase-like protein n=1 Tax=Luteolibacter yonseiensis TaxID=1144680 RepID=A0A934VDQ9_9BACT|nr:HAD hydrolase-like protein [Luteolibacter yonseiensis]MBK1818390.1 HAD hydrolase-like protein [Luteolibacter yonseiensis]